MNRRVLTTAASTFALVLALGASAEALGLGGLGGLGGGGGGGGGSGAGSHGNAGGHARGTERGGTRNGIGVGASIGRGGVSAGAHAGGLGVGASLGRGGISAGVSAGARNIGASVGAGGVSTSSSGLGAQDAGNGAIGNGKLSPSRIRALIRQARSKDLVKRREAQKILAANGVSMSPNRNPLARLDLKAGKTNATATLDNRAATRGRIADVKLKSGNAVNTRVSLGNRKAKPGVGSVAQADADALSGAAKADVSIGERQADRGNIADVSVNAAPAAKTRLSIGNRTAAPSTGTIAQADVNALDDTANAAASIGENNLDRGNVADVTLNAGGTANARASIGNRDAGPDVGSIAQVDAGAADTATADISVGRNATVEPDGSTVDGISADLGTDAVGTQTDANAVIGLRRMSRAAPTSIAPTAGASLSTSAPADTSATVSARAAATPDDGAANLSVATGATTAAAPAAASAQIAASTPAAAPAAGTPTASAGIGLGLGDEDGTPAAPGAGLPGTPGTPATVAGLTDNERRSLEKRCAPVQQSPDKYAKSVVDLCQSL